MELDMKISKLALTTIAAFATVPAASAFAQDAQAPAAEAATASPSLAAGQIIYGPSGEEVATVVSIADGNVVVDTGTQQATLPGSAITAGEKGATIGYTKEQLNAAIEAANKQASAGQAGATASTDAASNPSN
jgi:hypothetical protein